MAVDHLNFFIYEPDTAVQQKLRRFVTGYSIREDVDVRMDWVVKPEQLQYIPQLVHDVHIALLDGDAMPHSLQAGRQILEANSQCLILFYGKRTCDLAAYFPARPIAYLDEADDEAKWEAALRMLHQRICQDRQFFCWTSKFSRYFIPCSQILTLRSNRGNLEVHTQGGVHTMMGKLDEAEKRLPENAFLRVHKSTLVNISKIQVMDRSDKCLILSDGSRAYISKVHYKEVAQFVEDRLQAKTEAL